MIFRAKTEKNKEKPDGDTKKPAGFRPGAGNRAGERERNQITICRGRPEMNMGVSSAWISGRA